MSIPPFKKEILDLPSGQLNLMQEGQVGGVCGHARTLPPMFSSCYECCLKYPLIFCRVQGLIRAGALKETERPLWYDVYRAFPPKTPPKVALERIVPPRKILYLDDLVRS